MHPPAIKHIISIHALCEEGDDEATKDMTEEQHFYPRPLRGGRPSQKYCPDCQKGFLSTPSARRATIQWPTAISSASISIHALCEEGDLSLVSWPFMTLPFLSTPSARRATNVTTLNYPRIIISIHALCEEGDAFLFRQSPLRCYFYPRPLRGGRLFCHWLCRRTLGSFLSTPSARRATSDTAPITHPSKHFYPRPLRGGRRRAEFVITPKFLFISTPSARWATWRSSSLIVFLGISIHALCEEGDAIVVALQILCGNFYPRPLRGGRPHAPGLHCPGSRYFYPRPLRGGRRAGSSWSSGIPISIHALCEEGDPTAGGLDLLGQGFLSTPSARRATSAGDGPGNQYSISIHALCEEGDLKYNVMTTTGLISIHALCEEGDPPRQVKLGANKKFLSTPSARRATRRM